MEDFFIVISTVIFIFFALTWSRKTIFNLLIKTMFIIMSIIGLIVLVNIAK